MAYCILGVDVGTTALKMGIFKADGDTLTLMRQFSREYAINTYQNGTFSDIEPEKWQAAFAAGCKDMGTSLASVDVVSLSGTTPGLTVMDSRGSPLLPAILMLDQRSRKQAQHIIDVIGIGNLLEETGNMPVAGGCSLASLLWIKDNCPDIYHKMGMMGHSNTFMGHWLTGSFAMDPSSASLTALYNTVQNDGTWNTEIARAFDISINRLPPVMASDDSPGRMRSDLATTFGLKKEPPVVIGGNDAVLAAYSMGIQAPGDVVNVNGTSEITLVCLSTCYPSRNYNIRCHVIENRWLTLHVMNALGVAYEWFRQLFCSEMSEDQFYTVFIPDAVNQWLDQDSGVEYVPYLMGSRYSQQPLTAEFLGMTRETNKTELFTAMVKGLCEYQGKHLNEISRKVPLQDEIHVTGGALNPDLIRAKKKWMRNCDYRFQDQSSMKGAALLGLKFLNEKSG